MIFNLPTFASGEENNEERQHHNPVYFAAPSAAAAATTTTTTTTDTAVPFNSFFMFNSNNNPDQEELQQRNGKTAAVIAKKKPYCFCCNNHRFTREFYDELLLQRILPRVPVEERCILWDIDSLPMTTNCDIPSFAVLRQVFLFLPFELKTLLAAASTCRSWRIALDRHWAWKYLLPLKNEVIHLIIGLRWDKPAPFQRRYFQLDGKQHYIYDLSDAAKQQLISSGGFTREQHECLVNVSNCTCCCYGCGYCCRCGEGSTAHYYDKQEETMLLRAAERDLTTAARSGEIALNLTTEDEQELAERFFLPERPLAGWADFLSGGGNEPISSGTRVIGDQSYPQFSRQPDSTVPKGCTIKTPDHDKMSEFVRKSETTVVAPVFALVHKNEAQRPYDKEKLAMFDFTEGGNKYPLPPTGVEVSRVLSGYEQWLLRVNRITLISDRRAQVLDAIFAGNEFRKKWMFMSLSAFTRTTRELIAQADAALQRDYPCTQVRTRWMIPSLLLLLVVVCFTFSVTVGLQTPQNGGTIWPASDQIIIRNVALIVSAIYLPPTLYAAKRTYDQSSSAPAFYRRFVGYFNALLLVMSFCVPASLVGLRVTSAQMLLDSGSVSVCDAWSNITTTTVAELAGKTITKAADLIVDGQTLQCRIPESLRPSRLAAATFLELPPGTRLLYHPPSVGQRTVPFTASRSSTDSDTCTISQQNSVVSNFDAGANMTRTDVDRGFIGYYTVFLPASCNGAAAVKNATVMIIGDHPECPWWSYSSQFNATAENNNNVQMDSKFWSVLSNTTASEAIGNATSISSALGAAVTNLPATASAAKVQCMTAENVMVTVRGGGGADRHKFYLRVATGFQPHWTASYYHCRQPCDDEPWATRAKWTDTLDWQINGIVALTADTSMFLAHENSVSPVVPQQLPPFDGVWSDDGNAPFWTGAHPAGLRKLHLDMWNGLVGLLIFCGVVAAVAFYLSLFSRSISTTAFKLTSQITAGLVLGLPIAQMVIVSYCYNNAETLDMAELRQPVVCLQVASQDIKPTFIFMIVAIVLACSWWIFVCFALCNLLFYDDD